MTGWSSDWRNRQSGCIGNAQKGDAMDGWMGVITLGLTWATLIVTLIRIERLQDRVDRLAHLMREDGEQRLHELARKAMNDE